MTDTITTTAKPTVHVGQTWRRSDYSYRVIVLAVVEPEEGAPHVLYRNRHEDVGASLRCSPLDEFAAEFADPEWPTPEPRERAQYSVVRLIDGHLSERGAYDTVEEARGQLADLPPHVVAVGIQRVTTTTTSEWVALDEPANEADA